MSTLATLLAGSALSSLLMTTASQWAVFRVMRQNTKTRPANAPPITIMKPLKGLDDGLRENLLSFANQDYPLYEVLLGVEDPNDPALAVARQVLAERPDAPFTIVICPKRIGKNPKVSVLSALSARARYDHYLISDSNVRVASGYLAAMAEPLADPKIGLVTSVIVGTAEKTVGAALENLHLLSFIVRSTLAARFFLGHSCVIGKSMLLRARDLESVGGFASVCDVLAEDYVLGQAFQQAGFGVAISSVPVETVNERWPMERFMNRHIRWIQMRRRMHLGSYLIEPLFNPIPLLVFLVLVSGGGYAEEALLGMALKVGLDAMLWKHLRHKRMPIENAFLIPAKDILAFWMWMVGGVRTTVEWRGNRMRIGEGTRLLSMDDEKPSPAEAPLRTTITVEEEEPEERLAA